MKAARLTKQDRLKKADAKRERHHQKLIQIVKENYALVQKGRLACGKALIEIRDDGYWQDTHTSFKDYCAATFDISESYAHRLMDGINTINTLPEKLQSRISNEAQTRALSNVPEEDRASVVKAASKNGHVTAKSIEEAAREADLVIEAVPEEMESKIEIFTLLDKICRPTAILASNTSSLSISEIASVTYRAKKCLGMHFFNPVHKMKLLEVVRALDTDDDTLATAVEVGKRMGKEVVVIKEAPGFITSRINAMIGNEAFYMLQEGIATAEDIDKALKLGLNHPMGPFELVDLVGLDTRLHILEYLHKSLGEKFRPCPLLVQYVKAGRLGRKSGRGVFEYPESASNRRVGDEVPSERTGTAAQSSSTRSR